MGDWYTIGLALGLGTALGVLFAGLLTATPLGRVAAVVLAGAAGALAGALIEDWTEIGGGVVGGLVGAVAAAIVVSGRAPARRDTGRPRADRDGNRHRAGGALLRSPRRLPRGAGGAGARPAAPPHPVRALRRPAHARQGLTIRKKLILVVIDGLTPSMLEDTLERKAAPSLALLAEHGRYRRAISTFPSLTPVCLSALATGAHPDVHEIPHLVWYHRGEKRLVEYGSSFGAVRAAGTSSR